MSTVTRVVRGIKVEARKRVPLMRDGKPVEDGFATVPDGFVVGDVSVIVDLDGLGRLLGPKAMKSRRGRSVLAEGLITVKRVSSTKVPS